MGTAADILDLLERLDLLEAGRLPEARNLGHIPTAPAAELLRELVRRGWLTTYQANQLAQGRGADLDLGPYVLLDALGGGGMGQVFRARHRRLDCIHALKVISPDRLADPETLRRFQREARAAARLRHPNVVAVHGADAGHGRPYLAMEYIRGDDLARLVRRRGPLPVAEACDYIRQAALGLQHAHEQGLVHRDVKPHNLLVAAAEPGGQPVVKVLDFGLARILDFAPDRPTDLELTEPGRLMGTVDYMAPEQANDSRSADIRADLYSLGATLHFLLAGRPPFPEGSGIQRIFRHCHEPPQPLHELRSDVGAELSAVVLRLLAKKPEERPQTPAEVAAALAPWCGPAPPSAVVRPPSRTPRPRGGLVAAAITLGLVFALAAWALRSGPTPPSPENEGASWSLRELSPSQIPEAERPPGTVKLPVVAVLGRHERRFWNGVRGLALANDGRTLVTVVTEEPIVRLWDATTFAQRGELPAPGLGTCAAGAPRGRVLLGGWGSGPALWDLETRQQLLLRSAPTADYLLMGLAVSPDGRWAAGGGDDGKVRLWDLEAAAEIRSALVGRDVCAVAFSADGRTLACSDRDGGLRILDVPLLAKMTTQQAHGAGENVLGLAFTPDGRIVTGGSRSGVRVWEVGPPVRESARRDLEGGVGRLAVLPGGRLLVAHQRHLRILHLDRLQDDATLADHAGDVDALAVSADGATAWSACDAHEVRSWDLTGRRERLPLDGGPAGPVQALVFAADGRFLLSGGRDGAVRLWDFRELREVWHGRHSNWVEGVAISGDGGRCISGGRDRIARVWDAATGREIRQLPSEDDVYTVALSADGRLALTGGADGTARLWNLDSGLVEWRRPTEQGKVFAALFDPDGRSALIGTDGGVVQRRGLQDGALLGEFQGAANGITTLALVDGGRRLVASVLEGQVVVWDTASGQRLRDWTRKSAWDHRAAASPDGRLVLSVNRSDTAVLFDAVTGKAVREWDFPGPVLRAAFAPDGRHVATGNGNGTIYLLRPPEDLGVAAGR